MVGDITLLAKVIYSHMAGQSCLQERRGGFSWSWSFVLESILPVKCTARCTLKKSHEGKKKPHPSLFTLPESAKSRILINIDLPYDKVMI